MTTSKKFNNARGQPEKIEIIDKTNYDFAVYEQSKDKDRFSLKGKRLKMMEVSSK